MNYNFIKKIFRWFFCLVYYGSKINLFKIVKYNFGVVSFIVNVCMIVGWSRCI